ncbi:MAG: tetraacyldisaccharide 4'-kinase [Magnetococcales bacterium]|nr:tetraacyldisaccharide 4'-kinase [Magnetococcales bacterium]
MMRRHHLIRLLAGKEPPTTAGQRLLLLLLRPLGALYGAIMVLRRIAYRHGIVTVHRPEHDAAPSSTSPSSPAIISIGNLTTGGTGKTPMVLFLARHLVESGEKPVIVSRGYGQTSTQPVTVISDGAGRMLQPPEAADEAVLLARNLPTVPILTAPNRILGAETAIKQFSATVIILDDAFQHRRIHRDLEIVLLDARQPLANGRVVPAGLLREPPSALIDADLLILTRADDTTLPTTLEQLPAIRNIPTLHAEHQPDVWVAVTGEREHAPAGAPPFRTPFLFSGLADPDVFPETVRRLGIEPCGHHTFPDHHNYSDDDLNALVRQARRCGADALICTEKDGVKLPATPLPLPLFQLTMEIEFLADNRRTLTDILARKLGIGGA